MSRAMPAAFSAAMSTMTTSASSLSAIARATVAPTLPAPPTTVTLRFMDLLHACDDAIAELRAFDFGGTVHQAREIVRDGLRRNGAVHSLDDKIRGLGPAHVPQHHFTRKDYRAGIHLVEVGVLGGGPMRRFENGVAGEVVDVSTGRDADAADLRRERVRQVVAVEVRRRDDVEVVG